MSQHNNGGGADGPPTDQSGSSETQAASADQSEENVDLASETGAPDDDFELAEDEPNILDNMISKEVHRAAVDAETADLRDKLLRAVAETENMRKRMEREVAQARKFAVTEFVKDIIPLTDTFQRAIEAVPDDAAANDPALQSLMDGVTMTERQFLSVMEKHGVNRIEPQGEQFDPNFHQAIAQFPNPDVPSGTIMEVAQAGFVLASRVIRPAMVVVAQGGPKPGKTAGTGTEKGAAAATAKDTAPQTSQAPSAAGDQAPGETDTPAMDANSEASAGQETASNHSTASTKTDP